MNLGEITKNLSKLKNWSLNGQEIEKNFEFNTFKESLAFVNKVGELAEKHEHHPDIIISYNFVRLTLTTHSVRTLTQKDFALAEEIDKL